MLLKRVLWMGFFIPVLFGILHAQNLVPNGDFETYTLCPTFYNTGGPLECKPWFRATGGTPDYFNACHSSGIVGVPNNICGIQPAHSGDAYLGTMLYYTIIGDYREYPEVKLTSPLIAGTTYVVSFWYSLSGYSCTSDRLGVVLNNVQVTVPSIYTTLPYTPQLELDDVPINNAEWKLFSKCYVADGGEQYIVIGNFYPDAQTNFGTGCPPINGYTGSYLYIDDVSIQAAVPPDPIDLGDAQQFLCDGEVITYSFDPMAGDYLWQDNSTSATYTVSNPGTYAVTLTHDCFSVVDEVTITALAPPDPISLGSDTTICSSDYLWFDFDPGIGDYVWQDGFTEASYTITQEGIYAVTLTNACGTTEDQLLVSYYQDPIVDFMADTVRGCTGVPVHFQFDPLIGDYFWQDGSEGSDYTVNQSGTYSVIVTNPCGSDFSSVVVEFENAPVPDLGPDTILCASEVPYLIDLTGLAFAQEYVWNNGTTQSTSSITSAGIYSVTVSNACFSISDSVTVTVQDSVFEVHLPHDTIVCPGDTLWIDAGGLQGQYTWQDSSTTQQLIVVESGSYSVSISNTCGSGTDTMEVVFDDQLPRPDLGPDLNLCPGDQVILTAGVQAVNYLWQDGSTNDSIVISGADTIILTVSNMCSIKSDTMLVYVDATPPDANLPEYIGLCRQDSVAIQTGVAGAQYLWNTGDTTPILFAQSPGTYILTVTNSCGTDTDTTIVNDLGSAPVVDLGSDQTLCSGDTITISPGISGNYLWNDGSTATSYEISAGGTIVLTIQNNCGTDTDSMFIDQILPLPSINLGADLSFCVGDSIILHAGWTDVDLLWQDGSSDTTYIATSSEMIVLTISNNCEVRSDTLIVEAVSSPPNLNLGADLVVCEDIPVTIAPGLSGVNYLWQDGSHNSQLTAFAPMVVILEISTACGQSIDTVQLLSAGHAPQFNLGADTALCASETLLLYAHPVGADAKWQDGSTDSTLVVTTAGIYALTLTNTCGQYTDSILVTYSDMPPEIDLGRDTFICAGAGLSLNVPLSALEYVFTWNTGEDTSSIVVDQPGTYSVSVSNNCGLTSAMINIIADTVHLSELFPNHYQMCPGDTLWLNVQQEDQVAYFWDDGSIEPTIPVTSPGEYAVTLSSECQQLEERFLMVYGDCAEEAMYIPNTFSPNDDGVNDIFSIFRDGTPPTSFELKIYDRWGNTVFETSQFDFMWNGRFRDKPLPVGVYTYVINATWNTESTIIRRGDITLIR